MTEMRVLALVLAFTACAAPAAVRATVPPPTEAVASPSDAPIAYATAPASTPSPSVALPFCEGAAATDAVVRLCPDGVVLRIDGDIAPADMAAIVAQIGQDLAWVQSEFRWTLRRVVPIDVYASRDRYAAGLVSAFGYSAATADFVADNSVAFFEPTLVRIAVAWDAVRDRRPIAAIRHELTHVVTLEACAPRCDLVPAWLNEGEARLAEALVPGADWRMLRVRYEAASMAATGTLIPIDRLVTQGQWNALTDWEGYYKYQEAAMAVDLLRQDVGGEDAIARLYARIRGGDDVATAYERLAGRSFADFVAGFRARMLADAPAPGIVTISPGSDGHGVAFLVYGLPSDARATLYLPGRSRGAEELLISPQGASFVSLDASYPPGRYVVRVTGSSPHEWTFAKHGGRPAPRTPPD